MVQYWGKRPGDGPPTHLYDTNFGKQEPSAFGLSQQFQTQLGIRYSFSLVPSDPYRGRP